MLTTFANAASEQTALAWPASRMQAWQGPEHWRLELPTQGGTLIAERRAGSLELSGAVQATLALARVDPADAARTDQQQALAQAVRSYPRFAEVVAYRERVSRWLLGVFAVQFTVLWLLRRTALRGLRIVQPGLWAAWLAGGVWLTTSYF